MFVLALLVSCGPTKPAETKPAETTPQETTPVETKPAETETGEKAPTKNPSDTLVVSAPEFDGSYINGFGNLTYDVWVKNLIHDYATYATDEGGQIVLNKTVVVGEPETAVDADGNKTYTFKLNDKLVWNDGTKITAKDFVFSVLFTDSAQMKAAGSSSILGDMYPGYKAYRDGETTSFPGIKYVDDTTFQVTIAAENLPYFYETALVSVGPMPMHRYSPNLDLGEDGSSLVVKAGYTLSDADVDAYRKALEAEIPVLEKGKADYQKELDDYVKDNPEYKDTDDYQDDLKAIAAYDEKVAAIKKKSEEAALPGADGAAAFLLTSNAKEVANVYRFKPDVTAGAYNFVSNENGATTTVTLNDKYLGDFRGDKPTIKNVVVKTINTTLDVEQILTGDIDLATGVVEGSKIEKAKTETTKLGSVNYARNGFGYLGFKGNVGSTVHPEVRRAVAYVLDRQQFVQNFLGGYGSIVDGYYGLSQWMYQAREEEFKAKANAYTQDFDKANAELDASPYKFEKDGTTPWDATKATAAYEANKEGYDYWRYDAEGKKLVINHFGSQNNAFTDTVVNLLPDAAKRVGMEYNITIGDFPTLVKHWSNQENLPYDELVFNAFNLAVGIGVVFDPYYTYASEFKDIGDQNPSGTNDPKVDEMMNKMRFMDSSKTEEYADAWLEWQLWFNENLPLLPIYSNQYYDIFHIRVKGLETTPVWDWSRDIADLSLDY